MGIKSRSVHYLLAVASSTGISLLAMPIITLRLGPAPFGKVALAGTLTGIGATLGTLGTSFAVHRRLPQADQHRVSTILTTLCLTAGAISLSWAALLALVFATFRDSIGVLQELPLLGFYLLVVAGAVSPFWLIASELLTLRGQSKLFSVVTIGQTVLATAGIIAGLYLWDTGELSLYVGSLIGSSFSFISAMVVLRPHLSGSFDKDVRRDLSQGSFLFAQLSDTAYPVVERFLFSQYVGFAVLGLYTHSERYRSAAFLGTKAIGRAVWPEMLREARNVESSFEVTNKAWAPIHIAISVFGILMAANGDLLVSALTNDRFTDAYVFFAPWFVWILIQNSARPEFATVYAFGTAKSLARITLQANCIALIIVIATVPSFGAWGAVVGILMRPLFYRVLLRREARNHRALPFQDHWAVGGSIGILIVAALEHGFALSTLESLCVSGLAIAVALGVGAREVRSAMEALLTRDRGPQARPT